MTLFPQFDSDGSRAESPNPYGRRLLGMVTGGSLSEGLDLKLESNVSVEEVKVGQYVTVDGERSRFFCVVSDVRLETTDPALATMPPDLSNPLVASVLRGTGTFGVAHLSPRLTWETGPRPVRTIPPHYALAYEATQEELEVIFGPEDARHLWIGSPLDMENTFIRLDLQRLVERSSGVFGKSGTGKTFLTRILMAGILQKGTAVQLIYDMHDEYGWQGTSEQRSGAVKGLKQLFDSRVAVFTLDEDSSRARRVSTDGVIEIGYDEITPEDIEDTAEALALNELQTQAVYRLARRLDDRKWLGEFLELEGRNELADLSGKLNENEGNLSALHRRLQQLQRLKFLVPRARESSVRLILDHLERGKTVVLEFGRYRNSALAQVLVANMLSRRIYSRWADQVEQALGERSKEPPQLVITIEEAHKFLNPRMAGRTIFGTIAREMRKYNVTLLVVDQRPSGIDSEVLSQIGTKLTCLLEDEKDVSAILSGVSGDRELRSVLARLESVQQALIFGHAVPMPVVVRTREYGSPESYRSFGAMEAAELERQTEQDARDLFGL